MFNCTQFKELVIRPTLKHLGLYSAAAEELLVFTCATESNGGTYLTQVGGGDALGVYQMESATADDIILNYITKRPPLHKQMTVFPGYAAQYSHVKLNMGFMYDLELYNLATDLPYATAMARIHYLRVKEQLPPANEVDCIWEYYKKYYNTPLGKATQIESIKKYNAFVGG